eukprot:comp5173_c0_seq1/m.4311 comp5173_c0_seq1/g.4311  ORF comp5173_c0_seq1/g.4311 comp5173_c0_seq1/m.4311 type:complete len:193 (-) comp5173_c0_seq1:124-702(-)
MPFTLMPLPWDRAALEPHMSAETLDYHHGKHHQNYVNKLNTLIPGTKFENMTLEEIVKHADTEVLKNQAGQVFNHNFFWNSLSPNGGGEPTGKIADALNKDFGSFQAFKDKFSEVAAGHFGSGWAWLVENTHGKLEVVGIHDGDCPLRHGLKPILTCDVWEHAYYIQYRNDRATYIKSFWNLVNWNFANANL